jgi:Mg2+ and Co2+ transporter CorA
MSSISVQDSQISIEQSQRATRLTQLAFIYVPLSFVTGIFGMNVQQINGTGLSIWVCFVALAIIVVLTGTIFWALHLRGNKRKESKDRSIV